MSRWRRGLLAGGLLFSLIAPDMDIALGMLVGRGAFADHGGAMHSFVAAGAWSILFACGCCIVTAEMKSFAKFAAIGFAAYASHILLDACTYSPRGVMLLWPWQQRFTLPVPLFVGVRHSSPAAWIDHGFTVVTELLFATLVWLAARRYTTSHTPDITPAPPNTRHETWDTGHGTRDAGHGTRDTGHGTRETGHPLHAEER